MNRRKKLRTATGSKLRKKYTRFRPQIRSRHPSHKILRVKGELPLLPFRAVIRFGSNTELGDTRQKGGRRIELNTVQAIANSSNKKRMKQCFKAGDVRTAIWYTYRNGNLYDEINERIVTLEELEFPIIAKKHFGSKNKGNIKLDSLEEYKTYIKENSLNNVIFEKFYNFAREYRLHVTEDGCFYTCRKMIKRDTPDDQKWFKNSQNCVWMLETNDLFDKPANWNDVVKESVKALISVGLDFGAVDLRIQSSKENKYPSFIVIEINSAPSFGDDSANAIVTQKYKEILPKLLYKKSKN